MQKQISVLINLTNSIYAHPTKQQSVILQCTAYTTLQFHGHTGQPVLAGIPS